MSGPWDRPSSPDPGDEWPSEDLRSADDPWRSSDPWREPTPSASSGWDDWSPPAPLPDDDAESEPPATDLWSESWADEAPPGPPPDWTREPEPVRPPDDVPPPRAEPWSFDADPWAPVAEPLPAFGAPAERAEEPWYRPEPEPEPAPVAEPEAEPVAEPEPEPEPVPEAWPVPGAAAEPEPAPEPEAPTEPEPASEVAAPGRSGAAVPGTAEDLSWPPEPAVVRSEPSSAAAAEGLEGVEAVPTTAGDTSEAPAPATLPDGAAQAAAEPPPAAEPEPATDATPEQAAPRRRWWSSGPASWLGEPEPAEEAEPGPQSVAAEEPAETEEPTAIQEPAETEEPAASREPAETKEPAASQEPAETEEPAAIREPAATAPGTGEPAAGVEPEAHEIRPSASSAQLEIARELAADAEPEAEPAADLESDLEEPGAAAVAWDRPEAGAEPGAWGRPQAAIEPLPWDLPAPTTDGATPDVPVPAIAPVWSSERWVPVAAPPEPVDTREAEPTATHGGGEPEVAAAAAADLAPATPSEPTPSEPSWPDELEGTQVFPSTWSPPPPTAGGELEPSAGPVSTTFARRERAEELEEAEAVPTTAEQAVPWLIGAILLLAGMVIVLLALIFAGDASLGGGGAGPSGSADAAIPSGSAEPTDEPTPTPEPSPSAAPSASVAPTPTPLAIPEYGPLEMVYLGRSAPLAHIFLLRHDFTVQADPEVLAQDPDLDVRRFAWSPDGRVGVGLYADLLISVEPGAAKRRMADGISTVAFGPDPATFYAVRVTQDGANDVATVLAFDFASGDSSELASVSYARPSIGAESALPEAQFVDEGGPIRLFWLDDGTLRLWSLGGGVWEIDPSDGTVTPSSGDLPTLWSPRGNRQVAATQAAGTSTLELRDDDDAVLATTSVEGLVSHLRWSPDGDRVVFTLGRTGSGGGVLQDLFLWDLGDGEAPMQLTSTGAAFSAEWLGTIPVWRE